MFCTKCRKNISALEKFCADCETSRPSANTSSVRQLTPPPSPVSLTAATMSHSRSAAAAAPPGSTVNSDDEEKCSAPPNASAAAAASGYSNTPPSNVANPSLKKITPWHCYSCNHDHSTVPGAKICYGCGKQTNPMHPPFPPMNKETQRIMLAYYTEQIRREGVQRPQFTSLQIQTHQAFLKTHHQYAEMTKIIEEPVKCSAEQIENDILYKHTILKRRPDKEHNWFFLQVDTIAKKVKKMSLLLAKEEFEWVDCRPPSAGKEVSSDDFTSKPIGQEDFINQLYAYQLIVAKYDEAEQEACRREAPGQKFTSETHPVEIGIQRLKELFLSITYLTKLNKKLNQYSWMVNYEKDLIYCESYIDQLNQRQGLSPAVLQVLKTLTVMSEGTADAGFLSLKEQFNKSLPQLKTVYKNMYIQSLLLLRQRPHTVPQQKQAPKIAEERKTIEAFLQIGISDF